MKLINSIKNAALSAYVKTTLAGAALLTAGTNAMALAKTDLTDDTSGGKTLEDVASNIDSAAQTGASLIIQLVTIGGFVVVAISLYSLWKASKDDSRETPMPAIVGLFIGGAMAAVGSIMWIMKNTVVGGAAA